MKQKTRIASKLFAALVVLTLISCCFLGTTFARYTSGGSGTATVTVADWNVNVDDTYLDEADRTMTFGKLSPDHTQANTGTNTAKQSITITNDSSDVHALVTVTVGSTPTITRVGSASTSDVSDAEVTGTLSLGLDFTTSGTTTGDSLTEGIDLAPGASVTITGTVTWTTQSDAIDTKIGRFVSTVAWELSFTAVQNTTIG